MDKITSMSIDIETFSDIDLTKSGVYRYSESPAFEIMLFGVSVNAGAVTVFDLASGDTIPDEILKALVDDNVKKCIINTGFIMLLVPLMFGLTGYALAPVLLNVLSTPKLILNDATLHHPSYTFISKYILKGCSNRTAFYI